MHLEKPRAMLSRACLVLWSVACAVAAFKCPALPAHTATNINELHPNDVKVVMALGDSITAGFGMMGYSGGLDEFRGQSWSIGLDPNSTTLASFFRHFQPELIGGSLGSHRVEVCIDPICPPDQYIPSKDVFNAAQSGAEFSDLVNHQLDYLIKQVSSNQNVNMTKDWKVMTIFIGANDVCGACQDKKPFDDPEAYYVKMQSVVEKVRVNFPRTFVNVVPLFNLSQVYDLGLNTSHCANTHRDLSFECDCVFEKNGTAARQLIDTLGTLYNAKLVQLATAYKNKYADFAVIVQPFGQNTMLKHQPVTLLSGLDCFHPSLIGHQAMAVALWNNMLTKGASKKTSLNIADQPLCPSEATLLYTY